MPKVDIIIPAYNAARYLPAAIESVIGQTYEDWRILLIDDGSTDDTAEVVAPYVARLDEKMKYIRQANAGLPAARNTAIRNSSAEYLALLDADDVWLPHRLAESVACMDRSPSIGLSYGFNSRIDQTGAVIDTFDARQKNSEGRIAPYIYMRRVQLNCPTITFRRSCVDDVGPFDETMRATEDRDMWFRIALKYDVACVPKVLAYYRVSPNAMTTDPDRMLRAQLHFIRKHYGAPGCGIMARQIAMGFCYRQRAEALSLKGQNWAALRSSLHALMLWPFDLSNARSSGSLLLRCLGANGKN